MKSMKSTVERTDEKAVLKILGEQAPVGVCIMQDGKFCYVNSYFPVAIGYTADELVSKNSLEIVVPEDGEMVMKNTIKMLKGELLSPYQFRVICKDGSIIWVMATVKSIQYHGRRATLGNYMEVTEYKQMEETLKESAERYRELANSITDIFFAMDEHLRYTYWNKASEILTGIRAEDTIGKSLREIFPDTPETGNAEKVYREVLRTRQPQTFVNDFDINGRHYIFEISAYPSRGGISVFVKDITGHKQAEEKLKESEQKYRLLFETSPDYIVQIDREGRYLAANPATARSLGVPLEELIGKTLFEVQPQEVAQYRLGMVIKALDEWHPQIFEDERAGRYFYHIFIPTKTSDQKEAVQGITRDITERKEMEEALRQSEERYRTILEETGDGYFETDLAGNFIFVNDAQTRLLGYSREEMIGMNFRAFTPEEKVKTVFEAYNRMYKTGEPLRNFPTEIIRKDGSHGFAETSAFTIRNDKGEIIGFRGVRRDITERKEMEEALRQSEERYRTILEEMEDAYSEVDLAGNLTFVNNSVCRDLGYSRKELIGMSYKGFTVEEDIESVFRVFNEVYRTGVPNKGFSWRTIRKDGSHGFAETSVSPLRNSKGEIIGFRSVGRDIAERKQAEEALRQSEERYRTILEEMEDSYFEVDLAGNLTFANSSVCRDLGYSREELIGMSYKGFTVENDIESVFRVFNEVYRTGVPNKGFPWKTIRKDGSHGFAETSVSSLQNDKGEIIGFRGVGRDITERKQAEERLQQSEENYKTLFNSSVIGMYVLDVETMKVVMGNQAAAGMAGFSSVGQGFGINPLDFVIPEDRVQVLEIAGREFEQDLRRTHEVRVVAKDGGIGWISITSARIMHEGKLAALVSFTDITERKQAEEALRQSEENYRVLFDSTVIGTVVLDAETMKILMVNQAAVKMFGFSSAKEALEVEPFDFIMLENREGYLEIAKKALFEQNSHEAYELKAVTKDGREIWINATGARIMHGGKLAGLISFTDITEQKRQSERLMLTDRLASLGELASGTAHELNNPLTSIIGFSQLLMEREVPDDIREDLKLICSEAQRAASVTKNLLTFARKHAPVKQRDQINNIIEDVLKLRTYEHKVSGIEVERQLDPDLPEIMVDYFQMQQVFMNIIINAEYFMTRAHNKGTLTITTKKQSNTVMISFADDGPGIPLENLRRIFDPFFTTKEAGKGTGLGLSICHGIVTEHGGQIYAGSQLGKGATVFVELPINSRNHIEGML